MSATASEPRINRDQQASSDALLLIPGEDLPPTPVDFAPLFPAVEYLRSSIANEIIRRRQASGLSQKDLAKQAGIRVETLCRIETGKHTASVPTIDRIHRVLTEAACQPIRNGGRSMPKQRETKYVQQVARWLHHAAFAAGRSAEFRTLIKDACDETRVTYPIHELEDHHEDNFQDPELLATFVETWDQSEKEARDYEKELIEQGIVEVQAIVRGLGKKRPDGSRRRVIQIERHRISQLLHRKGIKKPFVLHLDKEYRAIFEATMDPEMVQIGDVLNDIVGEERLLSEVLQAGNIPENKKIRLQIKGREVRLLI